MFGTHNVIHFFLFLAEMGFHITEIQNRENKNTAPSLKKTTFKPDGLVTQGHHRYIPKLNV